MSERTLHYRTVLAFGAMATGALFGGLGLGGALVELGVMQVRMPVVSLVAALAVYLAACIAAYILIPDNQTIAAQSMGEFQ